jgi:hypothetical protein
MNTQELIAYLENLKINIEKLMNEAWENIMLFAPDDLADTANQGWVTRIDTAVNYYPKFKDEIPHHETLEGFIEQLKTLA